MLRLGAALIVICMALIAGSIGVTLYLTAGLSSVESSVVGIAVLTALVIYNAASTRVRDREAVGDQLADLSRGTADLARQVAEIRHRMEATEAAAASAGDRVRVATAPLAAEMETLGGLVKQLAESVAAHEAILARAAASEPVPAGAQPAHAAPDKASTDSATTVDH